MFIWQVQDKMLNKKQTETIQKQTNKQNIVTIWSVLVKKAFEDHAG